MDRDLIYFDGLVSMRMFEMNSPNIAASWREELCLFFVLWGNASVTADGALSEMGADDVIVINPNTVYEIHSSECFAVFLCLGIGNLGELAEGVSFNCDSSKAAEADKGNFYSIKHLIAKLLKENADDTERNEFFNLTVAFNLLSELKRLFPSSRRASEDRYGKRLGNIINYINAHYREGLTLKELAQSQNYSVPYFSTFFKKIFGTDFTTYYNNMRLERAVNELLLAKEPIEQIAHNNGFPDVRSFVSLFKKRYGVTPKEYMRRG